MSTNPLNAMPARVISAGSERARQYANPLKMVKHLWLYRGLIAQFTRREVLQRYKGSYLGLVWSFVTPLTTLLVYTFVFSVIFKARWGANVTGVHAEFALAFFSGLIAYNIFSESLLDAPTLIVNNPNYVKKVVFPLEILPVSILGSAIIHSLFSVLILLAGVLIFVGSIPWTIVLLPLMYIPLILLTLGLSWFFASLGVYIRDMSHALGVVIQLLFFMTPIIYPISVVPANLQFILFLNPLTFIVNHFRRVLLWGQLPDWGEYLVMILATLVICMAGYLWFMKSKKTFADVV